VSKNSQLSNDHPALGSKLAWRGGAPLTCISASSTSPATSWQDLLVSILFREQTVDSWWLCQVLGGHPCSQSSVCAAVVSLLISKLITRFLES
jgi:hypothetical protein